MEDQGIMFVEENKLNILINIKSTMIALFKMVQIDNIILPKYKYLPINKIVIKINKISIKKMQINREINLNKISWLGQNSFRFKKIQIMPYYQQIL